MARSKIAVFIDVENLTSWVKHKGPEKLVAELSATGQLIVRKAYGNWINLNIQGFQKDLNMQGFELIHNFHPISGKNSSDIQLTVDVMETAMRLNDIDWFVLATGDSDFSPLFRRLREMGKDVIGVGPRSALSESVKTSCTRYIYTNTAESVDKKARHKEQQKAFTLTLKALSMFDGSAHCSQLKNRIIALDSAFDEKALGYTSFTDFLKNTNTIEVFREKQVWMARLKEKKTEVRKKENISAITKNRYEKALQKKKWPAVSPSTLEHVFMYARNLPALPRAHIPTRIAYTSQGSINEADAKAVIDLLFKAQMYKILPPVPGKPASFSMRENAGLKTAVDSILFSRIIQFCNSQKEPVNTDILRQLAYGEYDKSSFQKVYTLAEQRLTH